MRLLSFVTSHREDYPHSQCSDVARPGQRESSRCRRMFKGASWFVAALSLVALGATQTGCNLQKFAADSTVKVVEAGAMGFNGFWDYEIFGAAVPSALLQSEALVQISPNNEKLLVGLARSYISYAYGWLQDRWEIADEKGDFETADDLEKRIYLIYERAEHLALKALHQRDKQAQLEQKLKAHKLDELKAYLKENFKEQEDVPALYFAGLAWGSSIANSGGNLDELADAPFARALLERSIELDPTYADAGGLGVLGTVEASFPEVFGGSL